jgi:RNA-directed DNA polymerase
MTERRTETEPTTVPDEARRVGEIWGRWSWAELSVWTERMLTALENGVKGGKWYSLMDKVYSLGNLRSAFGMVKANKGSPGIDHQTIDDFATRLEENLERVAQALRDGRYRPQAIKRVWIPKPGSTEKRPLGVPTVRDRVVQAALRNVLEPVFEKDFADHSYGFRPGRGCKDALRQVDLLLKQGYTYVVDADLKSYFDTIPHDLLMARIRDKIADNRILELVESFLKQQIMETTTGWTPETGTPQGAVLSPLLSNIYLDPLDHLMAQNGVNMVRYADDFVILCRTEAEALVALAMVQRWTAQAGLALHPTKTRIVDATVRGGFDFLGYHFERGIRWPRRKSLTKLRDAIRDKTRRNNGHSLLAIISDVNRTLKGWFEYFKHGHYTTFRPLDSWIRMRLRSVLRKRRGGRGRGRGADHHRWRNAFFAEQGLFSLVTAHAAACQSSRR